MGQGILYYYWNNGEEVECIIDNTYRIIKIISRHFNNEGIEAQIQKDLDNNTFNIREQIEWC